jgi:hypothetical protein
MFGLISNPWVIIGIIFALGSSCTTGYVAGRKHESNTWKAEQAQMLSQQITERKKWDAREYELRTKAADAENQVSQLHRKLQNEIAKNTAGRDCLGAGAVGVWNRAFESIRGMPEGSSRVPEASPVPNTTGATDTDVLSRANEVAEILNTCRQQVDNIRKWDTERAAGHD